VVGTHFRTGVAGCSIQPSEGRCLHCLPQQVRILPTPFLNYAETILTTACCWHNHISISVLNPKAIDEFRQWLHEPLKN
jgi:hypothetical protein